jgi:hypothetical protein
MHLDSYFNHIVNLVVGLKKPKTFFNSDFCNHIIGYGIGIVVDLSYNHQNRTQFNTVFVQQEEMDQVGFEPTTSRRNNNLHTPEGCKL